MSVTEMGDALTCCWGMACWGYSRSPGVASPPLHGSHDMPGGREGGRRKGGREGGNVGKEGETGRGESGNKGKEGGKLVRVD